MKKDFISFISAGGCEAVFQLRGELLQNQESQEGQRDDSLIDQPTQIPPIGASHISNRNFKSHMVYDKKSASLTEDRL